VIAKPVDRMGLEQPLRKCRSGQLRERRSGPLQSAEAARCESAEGPAACQKKWQE